MMSSDRQQAARELRNLRERAARSERFWWRAIWVATVVVSAGLWLLLFWRR
ncbi:MAG: hypothetical protein H0Z37_00570 [Firmicutes bacterium]|nr:hypothetical protein [Bacillota bacterium]